MGLWHRTCRAAIYICFICSLNLYGAPVPNRSDYVVKEADLQGLWRFTETPHIYIYFKDDNVYEYNIEKGLEDQEDVNIRITVGKLIRIDDNVIKTDLFYRLPTIKSTELQDTCLRHLHVIYFDKVRKKIKFKEYRIILYSKPGRLEPFYNRDDTVYEIHKVK